MRFKVDEDLPSEVGDLLRAAGHDTATVTQEGLSGRTDADIASVCQAEDRALVTMDMGFADIRSYPPGNYPCLLVLRLARQDKPYVLTVLHLAQPLLQTETLRGHLWIVEDRKVRIR